MSKPTIVTLPGDGIGGIVLEQALRVLDAAGFEADYVHGDIGWEFWCKEGNPLPQRTLDLIAEHKIALFGAITSKPNVVRETSGLMWKLAKEIQKNSFPEIRLINTNIDAQMMWLTKNPEDYSVIVAGNMFGDIASDGFAGLIGGLGFACSAQFSSDGIAVFEPTHGSAPKYADYKVPIVNPIAMIESACMMLDYINEEKISAKIRELQPSGKHGLQIRASFISRWIN